MGQVAIVGAGVSGLTCALALSEHNIDCDIFERCDGPGGHARTTAIGPFRFDHGPHVLVGIPEALLPIFSRLGLDLRMCLCNSSIYFGADGHAPAYIPAPIQKNLSQLPLGTRISCIGDYFRAQLGPSIRTSTRRQFTEQKLGRRLVELFIEPYDSKRLTYSLDEIDAAQSDRIPAISPSEMLWNGLFSGKARPGLDSKFFYPGQGGIVELPLALSRRIAPARLKTLSEAVRVEPSRRRIEFSDGRESHYDFLVSSIPLANLLRLIDDAPPDVRAAAEDLAYGSTYVFNIGFDGPLGGPHGIIRYPERHISFYRLSFPAGYAAGAVPHGYDAVVAEVGYHSKRRPRSAAEALASVHADLRATEIVTGDAKVITEQTIDVPVSHVVHTQRTGAALRLIHGWLEGQHIYCCGKYGEWRELLMPQSMMSGQRAAHAIIKIIASSVQHVL